MNPFKGHHFTGVIILWVVRWYCKYDISYRELQEMLAERRNTKSPYHFLGKILDNVKLWQIPRFIFLMLRSEKKRKNLFAD
ncbi:hypothetical protein SAMN05421579_11028 [Xenorhabdus japonica]|uniref:Transposase n=1 Tax=Xenorhabdus japonica TaxID=53341 RepID=A0A1I5A672_9GAMM|nr:hypothetical protein SAMN05421579_11028 [Xenorhabdus japonica]